MQFCIVNTGGSGRGRGWGRERRRPSGSQHQPSGLDTGPGLDEASREGLCPGDEKGAWGCARPTPERTGGQWQALVPMQREAEQGFLILVTLWRCCSGSMGPASSCVTTSLPSSLRCARDTPPHHHRAHTSTDRKHRTHVYIHTHINTPTQKHTEACTHTEMQTQITATHTNAHTHKHKTHT